MRTRSHDKHLLVLNLLLFIFSKNIYLKYSRYVVID